MAWFTGLFLVVACAALLQVSCEARQLRNRKHVRSRPGRRNSEDASISLGIIHGSQVITLPVIHLTGPDVIVGFPDNCRGKGMKLLGTELIVSNSDGTIPVDLAAHDANDPQSNVAIHCSWGWIEARCSNGVDVASYQYCGDPLPSPTTAVVPTTTPPSTTEPATSTPSSDSSSSSSSSSESSSSSSSSSSSLSSSSSASSSSED